MIIYKGIFFTILFFFSFSIFGKFERDRLNYAKLQELDTDWSLLSEDEIKELSLSSNIMQKQMIHTYLSKAKEHLVAGDIKRAKHYLSQIDDTDIVSRTIRKRYFAIIEFIEGEYNNSLKILKDPVFKATTAYPNICLLKVFNMISQKEINPDLLREYSKCSDELIPYSKNEQLWLYNLIKFKTGDYKNMIGARKGDIQYIIETNQKIRIWLKTGIYFNADRILDPHMDDLPFLVYKTKSNRELIGLYHYRAGRIKEALNFLEGIHSPNAENIKGNIALKKKQYVLAFGHFKLALKKKSNSKISLMRAIPLAWLLGLWTDGAELLKNLVDDSFTNLKKLTLDTAFRINMKEYKRALGQINIIKTKYDNKLPLKLHLMSSYLSIIETDTQSLLESTEVACAKFDGLNCWLLTQTLLWEDITLTATREDKTFSYDTFDIENLKEKAEISSLKEKKFIDQRDIEELDSGQIKFNLNKI